MARKAAGFQDSGGREPEVFIKMVFDGCARERKPRTLSMMVPEDFIKDILESARPQGRARKRVRRKGRGCVERRKRARAKAKASREVKLSPAAEEFLPLRVAPPLPREPEPGSMLYRAVAKKATRDGVLSR